MDRSDVASMESHGVLPLVINHPPTLHAAHLIQDQLMGDAGDTYRFPDLHTCILAGPPPPSHTYKCKSAVHGDFPKDIEGKVGVERRY